jgi:hypothetical protein
MPLWIANLHTGEIAMPPPNTINTALARIIVREPSALPTGCWEWTGHTNKGYGIISIRCKNYTAHRLIYQHYRGPVSDDMDLHHECENRICVNPDHLTPKTRRDHLMGHDNCIPAIESRKTHCSKGHPYSGRNLAYRKSGVRRCLTCERIRDANKPRKGGGNREKKCCPKGHPYEGGNLIQASTPFGVSRRCRVCRNDQSRKSKAARRANR